MKNNFFNKPLANIYSKPFVNSEVVSQILYGEKFTILSIKNKWIKIKTNYDNYAGYIKKNNFFKKFKPTKKIYRLRSKIFKKKGNKFFQTKKFLYFGSGISIMNEDKKFFEFEKNKWIKKNDTKEINHHEKNIDKILKYFLNIKYLWGGKTSEGIDCSALIQIYFYYNRNFFPRDSKDQMKYCKKKLIKKQINDKMIFWKGHVAYCLNKRTLIHAYGPKKKVVIMSVEKAINKIFKDTKFRPIYV
ncbi:C40 family peptidase [Candidatus Pelagibacter sp.]|nr:C40 family peptidase [Candidatus Pelagibacter sp.]